MVTSGEVFRRLKTEAAYLKFHAALSGLPDFSSYFNGDFDPHCLAHVEICPSIEYFESSWNDARHGRPSRTPVMEVQIPSVYDSSNGSKGPPCDVDLGSLRACQSSPGNMG